MRMAVTVDALSRRAPRIVGASLCIALLAYWFEAPLALPYALATILAVVAIAVAARRKRDERLVDSGAAKNDSWIAHELAGNGSPPGSYVLAFFAFITVALTGFVGPYALPGWASLALSAAWGFANARYPSDEV